MFGPVFSGVQGVTSTVQTYYNYQELKAWNWGCMQNHMVGLWIGISLDVCKAAGIHGWI
jgi:hypothetical protein